MATATVRQPKVAIIGAGMTGILLVIKLREAGITDITVFEKKDKIGGTWRENTYPGVACDVPAQMYTYEFEPNPDWSNRYADGAEIQAYFERVARKYGVLDCVRFNEAVTDAIYHDGKWQVKTSRGTEMEVDFLISATGILHHPARPDIKGIDSFAGALFHTAEWRHDVDLTGKRVGVIGTGSTAAQVVPEVAKIAKDLYVFQRTAQWILSSENVPFTEEQKERYRRYPWLLTLAYYLNSFFMQQLFSKAVIGKAFQHKYVSLLCKANLWLSVRDKTLRKKLTPNYKVGCKRIILNNVFYDAVQKPNVHLITDKIASINPAGIQLEDGKQIDLDVIVLATGFHPFNFMRPMNMVGKNGVHIDQAWKNKIQAYRSVFLPDFPNFFLMLGPNTPIGNYSVIAMSEVQTKYILQLIEQWRAGKFNAISPKPEALKRYNEYLKAGMGPTAWVGGCQSWYLDKDGDPAMWPYTWKQWVEEMRTPNYADFDLV
ncbi:MAG TPA: NAD(P)/FAD-dependent oxidoreductase [Pseudomonadales bacterium]|nr:NAD(P)/FAD-dependent oxidoreductase [Pseudomonadales bacterium]